MRARRGGDAPATATAASLCEAGAGQSWAAAYKPGDEKGERPRQVRAVGVINGGERRVRPLLPQSHKMAK